MQDPVRNGDAPRGRRQLLAVFGAGTLAILLVGIGAWLQGGAVNWLAALGRPIVLAGLGGLAWQGRSWARTAATIWMAVLAILILFSAVPLVGVNPGPAAIFFAIGLLFAVAAFVLQTSPHIDAALAARRRTPTNPPAA